MNFLNVSQVHWQSMAHSNQRSRYCAPDLNLVDMTTRRASQDVNEVSNGVFWYHIHTKLLVCGITFIPITSFKFHTMHMPGHKIYLVSTRKLFGSLLWIEINCETQFRFQLCMSKCKVTKLLFGTLKSPSVLIWQQQSKNCWRFCSVTIIVIRNVTFHFIVVAFSMIFVPIITKAFPMSIFCQKKETWSMVAWTPYFMTTFLLDIVYI